MASGTCARCSGRRTSPALKAMHLMTGNLSHQIEHHLFPDLPSNRYAEIAPRVEALFDKYEPATTPRRCRSRSTRPGTGSSGCRCPTAGSRPPTARTRPEQLKLLWAMSTKGPKVRRAAQARLQQGSAPSGGCLTARAAWRCGYRLLTADTRTTRQVASGCRAGPWLLAAETRSYSSRSG